MTGTTPLQLRERPFGSTDTAGPRRHPTGGVTLILHSLFLRQSDLANSVI